VVTAEGLLSVGFLSLKRMNTVYMFLVIESLQIVEKASLN
jgi:hypothetical protein